MSLESTIEEIIQDAIARGEFDNLPGKGKPLDHDAYFALPEDQRLAYSMLRNAGFVPEEVALLKEIKELRERLDRCGDPTARKSLYKALDEHTLKFNLLQEQKQQARRKARKAG